MAPSIAPAPRRVSPCSGIVEAEHRRFYEHERRTFRPSCRKRMRRCSKISPC
jgi:hypothetical protein